MSSAPWTIRVATVEDLDEIMRIETSVFVNDAWSTRSMRSELSSGNCYYLVAVRTRPPEARESDRLGKSDRLGAPAAVGSASAEPAAVDGYAGLLAPRGAADADIQTIAVAPLARRRGLGRALASALIDEARARGATSVFLEVRADNPNAQTLYRQLGFEAIGVRAGYYQPDNVDAVVMQLGLAKTQSVPVGSTP